MKLHVYSVAVTLIAETVAVKYTAPRGNTPPLDTRDLSARGSNLFARQGYDYCGTSTYYYCYGAECCGVTTYNCMPSGAECCASLSMYGYGLYCEEGTCTVVDGYVQCANDAGDTFTAGSSAADRATSTSEDSTDTATDASEAPTSTSGSSGSESSKSKSTTKKKSKAWIAGAVAGPLIGIAIIAAVLFFLTVVRKKKKANANATNAAIMANQQNGGAPGGGFQQPMAPAPQMTQAPQTGAAPMSQHPDYKTPAYTQQYEVPTPIASPPPQWTPASPAPTPISPVPVNAQPMYAQQDPPSPKPFTNELHAQSVSPMSTGNGGGYVQPMHQPQPVHGNAMELPTAPASQPPRGGAQELHG